MLKYKWISHGRSYIFAIAMAVSLGSTLAEAPRFYVFHCYNHTVVSIWEFGSICTKEAMVLVHLLYLSVANIILLYATSRCTCPIIQVFKFYNVSTIHSFSYSSKQFIANIVDMTVCFTLNYCCLFNTL